MDGGKRAGQGGHHHVQGGGARDDDGLFVECVEDLVHEAFGHARGLGPYQGHESSSAGFAQGGRGAVLFE
ncbi:hypothetical protein GCM10010502_56880 [Kitasatospora aureofaciens]|uniref:Uncharacterized protein n=1 Tax=Kitasatospora aureofaciens TaxID=1894 RepID=A0A8H9LXV1_KITAU|nr:hypothetical protein GCM10010502_56880 [Kitasatospora aureofaciens]